MVSDMQPIEAEMHDMSDNLQQEPLESCDNAQTNECPERVDVVDGVLETPADISDRYRFVRLLGQGTQGKVFDAVRLSDNASVAIKVLQIRSIQNWKEYDLFWREARTLRSLQIEGVAQFYEALECLDSDDPHAYLVQQHIHGKSLSEMLKSGAHFSIQDIFLYAEQIVKVLKQLHHHDQPIIHRDIKPSNIMLEPDERQYRVYLMDFGAVYNPQIQKGGSTVAGTFGYMPPEQLMGHVTEASDIYALGVTLTELLSGISPSDMENIDLRLSIEKPLENVPYPVVSLLRRMTMPNVDERLCDHDVLLRYFHQFAQGVFSEDLETELVPVSNFKDALKHVTHLGQKGNLDLWLALPEQTPREIPKCYQHLHSFPRKPSLFIQSVRSLIPSIQKSFKEIGYIHMFGSFVLYSFSISFSIALFIIMLFLAIVEDSILWWIAAVGTICMFLAVLLRREIRSLMRPPIKVENPMANIHTLLQNGRKSLATVVNICFMGKTQDAIDETDIDEIDYSTPEFLVRYAFKPINDAFNEQVIHEIIVTNAPAVSPGDSIPILYDIKKTKGEADVVTSMPFPLPVRSRSDLLKCYCTTRNGKLEG